MKQFILNNEPDRDNTVRLEDDDYRYLVRIRRLAVGEYFPARLPDGKETLVQIISINKNSLKGKCVEAASNSVALGQSEPASIILFQAMPKSDKMDIIVRQAAETGIKEIVPFISEFSVAKANISEQKYLRWEKIIKEARQQSGSAVTTVIHRPLTAKLLFEYWNKLKEKGGIGLLFHHLPLEKASLHSYLNINPSIVVPVIGPEGGFSDIEVSCFLENGFKPLTFGDTILRTETAALFAVAAIRILLWEKNSWELKKT
jgi:16S rRNA (uracil1498-N3)-methyltransferase